MKRFPKSLYVAVIAFSVLFQTLVPLHAQEMVLPRPGTMVHLSPAFSPSMLKGIKVYTDNPFRFDFIVAQGDATFPQAKTESILAKQEFLKEESSKLIKYFLAALTIPEKDLWVNLSPYEKDRIVPDSFGQTQMGRDLLAEDYILKQMTASLIYPEDETGKKFWKRVYQEAARKFGKTDIPLNTFNKVWIVPEKAVVYENDKTATAYVVESRLKVMLESDYLSATKAQKKDEDIAKKIVREIVLPQLNREINAGKNFAQLRQVYNSFILATWYKNKIKNSILHQVYNGQNKVQGIQAGDTVNVQGIYNNYLQAFKQGAYNFIREEKDPVTQRDVVRKYFSGGVRLENAAMQTVRGEFNPLDKQELSIVKIRIDSDNSDFAMTNKDLLMEFLKDVQGFLHRLGKAVIAKDIPIPTKVADNEISKRVYELVWKSLMDKLREYSVSRSRGVEAQPFRWNTYWFKVMNRFAKREVGETGWFLLPTIDALAGFLKVGVDYRAEAFKNALEASRKIYLLNDAYDASKPIIFIVRGAFAPPRYYNDFYLRHKDDFNVAYFEYTEFGDISVEADRFISQLEQFLNRYGITGRFGILAHSNGTRLLLYSRKIAKDTKKTIFEREVRHDITPVPGGSAKASLYDNVILRKYIISPFFGFYLSLAEAHSPHARIQRELTDYLRDQDVPSVAIATFVRGDAHNRLLSGLHEQNFDLEVSRYSQTTHITGVEHNQAPSDPVVIEQSYGFFQQHLYGENDSAMKTPGGIDLNAQQMAMSFQKGSGDIIMQVDPKMIEQMRYISGFVPVILDIQPLNPGESGVADLRLFLGLP